MQSKIINSVQTLVKNTFFHTFLIDASGVIYNEDGVIDSASECISYLQSIGNVFLVTNNSYMNPSIIKDHLENKNISINESCIISSGHGLLEDNSINKIIRNKTIYVFGRDSSHEYVKNAICHISMNINDAEAIILTASLRENTIQEYEKVKNYCLENPNVPIICCNPDNYVKGIGNSLITVIGYYGRQLEKELDRKLYWVGKPYINFSKIVKNRIEKANIKVDTQILFFDDNHHNVIALQNHIGISGCLITETGLSHNLNPEEQYCVDTQITYQLHKLTR